MTDQPDLIYVKSHVARDLLQSAALFKNEQHVVWEYVSNSLQYVDLGTTALVQVKIDDKRKRITISDNGSGMDWAGLQNFFIMHGENLDRKRGRRGRGRFGTGKSAAFGIADTLRLTTVRNGQRTQVELTRVDIDAMGSEAPIPIRIVEKEQRVDLPNGTVVEIGDIKLRKLDVPRVRAFIEHHLARWPKGVEVLVNGRPCQYAEPPISDEYEFVPEGQLGHKLGFARLQIKVAQAPLPEEQRGVGIYANGVWLQSTLAGSEGREMSQYIFGSIDVPHLDNDSPIPAFDMSRSMQLNPNNEVVAATLAFVGQKVDFVRRKLVALEKMRKDEAEARRLAHQAAEIARIINEDFNAFSDQLERVRARASGRSDLTTQERLEASPTGTEVTAGDILPGQEAADQGSPGADGGSGGNGTEPRTLRPLVVDGDADSSIIAQPASSSRRRGYRAGGFSVDFRYLGESAHRAMYERAERAINVNLDHPQVVAARGDVAVEDRNFLRLMYEIAFSEYAIALSTERADEFLDLDEPIIEIRNTIDRVSRRAASLFAS